MTEQVAVVDAGAAAELAHRLAEAGLDERVDHHGRPAPGSRDGELQVVDRLDARMADLREPLLGKLRLERQHEPCRRLARRVRDDMELDRAVFVFHGRRVSGAGGAVATIAAWRPATPRLACRHPGGRGPPRGVAVRTPLLRLPLDDDVFVKPESLQRTGSFKFRGAFNALASTPRADRRGVVADSSGNHAQGVAAAAVAPRRAGDDRDARERRSRQGGADSRLGRRDHALRELERGTQAPGGRDRGCPLARVHPTLRRRADHRRTGHRGARDRPVARRASRRSSYASAAAGSSRASRRRSRRSVRRPDRGRRAGTRRRRAGVAPRGADRQLARGGRRRGRSATACGRRRSAS